MPTPLSAVDSIAPAIGQTKQQLFAPFRWQRWARLAIVCLVLADFAGGGGGVPSGAPHLPSVPSKTSTAHFPLPGVDMSHLLPWIPLIAAAVALLFVLGLLWVYMASVYRFVLFDSVLYNRCELKGSWTRWERYGRSFFLWLLVLFAVFWAGEALLITGPLLAAWRAGLFVHPGQHLVLLILGGLALALAALAFMVAVAVAGVFAKDFCLPIMALEDVGVVEGWRRLLPMLAAEKLAFAFYVLMKVLLNIGTAIIFGIVTLIAFIPVLVVVAIAGVIVFFGGKAIGLTLNFATVTMLALAATAVVSALFYLVALISTPAMVFFQSYALHFFGSRYPRLGDALSSPGTEAAAG